MTFRFVEETEFEGIRTFRMEMEEDSYDATTEKNKGMRYANYENVVRKEGKRKDSF